MPAIAQLLTKVMRMCSRVAFSVIVTREFRCLAWHAGGAVTRVRIVARLDPRLPFVPGFLISFLLKVVAPYVYRQACTPSQGTYSICRAATDVGTVEACRPS